MIRLLLTTLRLHGFKIWNLIEYKLKIQTDDAEPCTCLSSIWTKSIKYNLQLLQLYYSNRSNIHNIEQKRLIFYILLYHSKIGPMFPILLCHSKEGPIFFTLLYSSMLRQKRIYFLYSSMPQQKKEQFSLIFFHIGGKSPIFSILL